MAEAYGQRLSQGHLLEGLLPPTDGIGADQSGVVLCCAIAHAERIAIGEVFRDVAIVGERDMRALSRQTDVVPAVYLVAMRKQPNSGSLTSTNSGKQHGVLPGRIGVVQPLCARVGEQATVIGEEICGRLRISRTSHEDVYVRHCASFAQ